MLKIGFCNEKPSGVPLTYVVIAARYNGEWVFVRHRERDTYEIPGGHIETGEDYLAAAKRELYEETGAKDFALDFISIYTVMTDKRADGGYLFYADIKELSVLPESEIAEVILFDELPENLTYPLIQPQLHSRVLEWMTSRRLKFKTTPEDKIHMQNKSSWNAMSDSWSGTILPTWGCSCPAEDELCLLPDLSHKKILEIGCGSGHSLKWCGRKGAAELWGLDISERQLEHAAALLRESGYAPKLFVSPMEHNPGLPQAYFDVVYSVYAIGWTTDLQTTFDLISSYLKTNGIFIFSWDHPFMHCVDEVDGKLFFSGSYYEIESFTFQKNGNPLTLYNRRVSDYINALSKAGFTVEQVIEETDKETLNRDEEFTSGYYSSTKAKKFPLSIVIRARKI